MVAEYDRDRPCSAGGVHTGTYTQRSGQSVSRRCSNHPRRCLRPQVGVEDVGAKVPD